MDTHTTTTTTTTRPAWFRLELLYRPLGGDYMELGNSSAPEHHVCQESFPTIESARHAGEQWQAQQRAAERFNASWEFWIVPAR